MRQRQVRKGQGQQTKDSFDVNAKIPAYEKERIAVHETIKKSGMYWLYLFQKYMKGKLHL